MKFKTDENLPMEVAELLRNAGYEALTVWDQSLEGSYDQDIAQICRREERILVTLDLDFSDLRAYPPTSYPGLIVLRLQRQSKEDVLEVIRRILPVFQTEQITNRLWLVDEKRVRIRGEE